MDCPYRAGSRQRRVTLARADTLDLAKAREAAGDMLAAVRLGGDPQSDKLGRRFNPSLAFATLTDHYLAFAAARLRPKSLVETQRYLKSVWQPLETRSISEITRIDIAAGLTAITHERGTVSAVRARAALSSFFVWAMREGLAEINPVVLTNKPASPRPRSRILNDGELVEIWRACNEDDYGRIVRLLILTGQRLNEVGGMTRSEIDVGGGTWLIPGERTKNHRPHVVPLSDLALAIIEEAPHLPGRDPIFGKGKNGFSGWSAAKARLDARLLANRREADPEAIPIPAWTPHDLRRTMATRCGDLGVSVHVIEALLNHISGARAGVAGVYNRSLYAAEKRAAAIVWTNYVQALVESRKPVVVPLRQA